MVLLMMFVFRQPSIVSFGLVLLSFGVFTLVPGSLISTGHRSA
jgi:hypothetical protein